MPKHSYWRQSVFPELPLPVEDQTPLPEHVWFSPFYQIGQHLQRIRSGQTLSAPTHTEQVPTEYRA